MDAKALNDEKSDDFKGTASPGLADHVWDGVSFTDKDRVTATRKCDIFVTGLIATCAPSPSQEIEADPMHRLPALLHRCAACPASRTALIVLQTAAISAMLVSPVSRPTLACPTTSIRSP
jgi:hypothetical protein